MADLKSLSGASDQDRRMIEDALALLGPEPSSMGAVKNLFWGNFRQDLLLPYPVGDPDEIARCEQLLAALDDYLLNEHPATLIDQEQEIPRWVIERLFELGVLGMTIPREFGGGGFGITSYNRALEHIGRFCGSTAVMVSAHQSIGCKAIMMYGTAEQKRRWLPKLAGEWLSAFCLSEPQVGSDASGQETNCHLSADGQHFILNGEKKWATSGALAQVFTVMARQKLTDPKTGAPIEKVTALVCTPQMQGVEIFQKNRSKCGVRGTWQARIAFHDVHVPISHLLHQEGKGLNVALSCLDYGRCTLSAGMLGGAARAFEQSTKWAQTRFQFHRPLADFELVSAKIARMAALCYAMDAMLYMTTGMLDRNDADIMLETAICKVFCSAMGWEVVNEAMQIMGGEGYMTENEIERIFRDSRINLIVEGGNEVMQSFIFGYGGKRLAESMLAVRDAFGWDKRQSAWKNIKRLAGSVFRPAVSGAAASLAMELFLGRKRAAPRIDRVQPALQPQADRLCRLVRDHSHNFKLATKINGEKIISRQLVQARLADSAIWLHAYACTLSKLDRDMRQHGAGGGELFARDRAAAMLLFDMAETQIRSSWDGLFHHHDESTRAAADAALRFSATLPNDRFIIPESSPNARGTGRRPSQAGIKQFPGDQPRPVKKGIA
jgi:alkylation response protein AidB-like acyl-CoA dehydrogenase